MEDWMVLLGLYGILMGVKRYQAADVRLQKWELSTRNLNDILV
jgi:hypothetical protein